MVTDGLPCSDAVGQISHAVLTVHDMLVGRQVVDNRVVWLAIIGD